MVVSVLYRRAFNSTHAGKPIEVQQSNVTFTMFLTKGVDADEGWNTAARRVLLQHLQPHVQRQTSWVLI